MSDRNLFRAEIEQILLAHSHTRAAKVLRWEKRNLDNAQMSHEASAEGEPCNAESIAHVRRMLRLTLADELVPAPSDAQEQAGIYRELLNHPRSPNLHQHIRTRLTQLKQMDPNVKLTPLEHGHLGANNVSRPEKQVPPCRECNLVHPGECW
jgi:hypothetical protein